MKIKEYLIHKLGGYTKEEYDKVNAIALQPLPVYRRYDVPIRQLKACYRLVDREYENFLDDYVYRHLVNQLCESLLDEHMITFLTDNENSEVRAILKVVEPREGL